MQEANQHTINQQVHGIHHEKASDGLQIKNGLFKHIISNRHGKLVCLKLYANGWSITTGAGTVNSTVRLNGNDVEVSPSGNIRKASLVLSDYVPVSRPQRVEKVVVDSIHGTIEIANGRDGVMEISLDGQRIGELRNPEKRSAMYELDESISLTDAAILYCMAMLAVRFDDVDIV